MQLSHNEAKLIAGIILSDFEHEHATTIKVLEAMPAGKEGYAPHPRSMPALELAYHIVSSECYFLETIAKGVPPTMDPDLPASIRTARDVITWAEARIPTQIENIKALSAEALSRPIAFGENMQMPGYTALQVVLKHSIHHRGQLSSYLRPMGGLVPSIYGPSADTEE